MSISDALRVLSEVRSSAIGLLPAFSNDARNLRQAELVFDVFNAYEVRLRALPAAPGGSGLTNAEHDSVQEILKSAGRALKLLKDLVGVVGDDAALSLERAYANGAQIEAELTELIKKRNAALAAYGTLSRSTSAATLPTMPAGRHLAGGNVTPMDIEALYNPGASRSEDHRRGSNLDSLPPSFYHDFDSPITSEGKLKDLLLSEESSEIGVSGMPGVGKTSALIALGHDRTVRARFPDGVLYLPLGNDPKIAEELANIMQRTGAKARAATVRNETNLMRAIEEAALWFQGKRHLFLLDDVWPNEDCREGYLPKLRKLLTGSPDSRIVLTTQCTHIGSHVDFDAREPGGPESAEIQKTCHKESSSNRSNGSGRGHLDFMCWSSPLRWLLLGAIFLSTTIPDLVLRTHVASTRMN